MPDEAYWADLRPILQDMADRIARIEQFLAASGLQVPVQAPGLGSSFAGAGGSGEVFDAVPPSFGAPPPAGGTPSFGGPPGGIHEDILLLARSGKKIQAIKEFRKMTGMGLKEAKAIIDQAARGY